MAAEAEAVAADLLANEQVAEASLEGEPTAPEADIDLPDLPAWEADTTGIEDILDQPDDLEYEVEDTHDPEPVLVQTDEYADPEVARLRAELAKERKQTKYLADLRAKDNLKGWRAEASRRFPLADVDEIEGQSRRAVLRKAKEQHDRYERKLSPVLSQIEELKKAAFEVAKAEAREVAADRWGKPVPGPQTANTTAAEAEQQLDRRKFRNPYEMVKARMEQGLEI